MEVGTVCVFLLFSIARRELTLRAGLDRCIAEHESSGKSSTQNLFAIVQGALPVSLSFVPASRVERNSPPSQVDWIPTFATSASPPCLSLNGNPSFPDTRSAGSAVEKKRAFSVKCTCVPLLQPHLANPAGPQRQAVRRSTPRK